MSGAGGDDPHAPFWENKIRSVATALGSIILLALIIVLLMFLAYKRLRKEIALRQETENKLLLANDLLERTSKVAKVGGWVMDLENNSQVWTDEGNRIREIPPGSVLSYEQALAFYDPETRARLTALRDAAIRAGSSWSHESQMTTASGKNVWVQGRGEAVVRDGKTVLLIGTIQDITERKLAELALVRTTHLLQAIIDTSPLRIFWKDRELRYLGCNPVFARDAGFQATQEVVGKDDFQMPWKEQADRYRADDRRVIDSGISILFYEEPQTSSDGQLLWLRTSKIPLLGESHEIIGVLCFYEDITDEKRALLNLQRRTAELEMHNRILRQINQGMPLIDTLVSMTLQIEALHPDMLCSILLLDAEGQHLRLVAAPSLPDDFNQSADGLPVGEGVGCCGTAAYRGERVIVENLLQHSYWASVRDLVIKANLHSCWSQPILNHRNQVLGTFAIYHREPAVPSDEEIVLIETYASLAELVIERHRAEEQIRSLAYYDTLTKLPNRRMLDDRLGLAMAASKRSGRYGALMFLDLDNFKPLNDAHGHAVGDLLLIEVGQRIVRCVRETDTVARFGGDEFVVMLVELDESRGESIVQAEQVAEKIRMALAEPYVLTIHQNDNPDIHVEHRCTASIGVAMFINHESTLDEILKWADVAMYRAKDEGRNTIRFHE
ncbi:MAG: diguanylate cyclase [Betaproteobacteria bacterium]